MKKFLALYLKKANIWSITKIYKEEGQSKKVIKLNPSKTLTGYDVTLIRILYRSKKPDKQNKITKKPKHSYNIWQYGAKC